MGDMMTKAIDLLVSDLVERIKADDKEAVAELRSLVEARMRPTVNIVSGAFPHVGTIQCDRGPTPLIGVSEPTTTIPPWLTTCGSLDSICATIRGVQATAHN